MTNTQRTVLVVAAAAAVALATCLGISPLAVGLSWGLITACYCWGPSAWKRLRIAWALYLLDKDVAKILGPNAQEVYVEGKGTCRRCRHCDRWVVGGPSACTGCANE